MKKSMKIIRIISLMLMVLLISACAEDAPNYVPVELEQDIFFYDADFGAGKWQMISEDEEGESEPLYEAESGAGGILQYDGTFYCERERQADMVEYYADDQQYSWNVEIDTEEENLKYALEVSKEEQAYLNEMESLEKDESLFLAEASAMGSLIKVSKDGLVSGRISLLRYAGDWYWQTEIIDETRERDGDWPEYIQPLPASLSKKIDACIQ